MSKKVYEKIHAVMAEIGVIEKTGFNQFNKYKYASDSDLVENIRPLLIKHRLLLIPSQEESKVTMYESLKNGVKEGEQFLTELIVKYKILDVDSGEYIEITSRGQGSDKGDKGIYKAATGASKYLMLKLFCLETSDDPENDKNEINGNGHKPYNQNKPPQKEYAPKEYIPNNFPMKDATDDAMTKAIIEHCLRMAQGDSKMAELALAELSKFVDKQGETRAINSFAKLEKVSTGWKKSIMGKIKNSPKKINDVQPNLEQLPQDEIPF